MSAQVAFVVGMSSCGKDIVCQWLAEQWNDIHYISVSDLLKKVSEEGKESVTPTEGMDALDLAVMIRDKLKSGELVPDKITIAVLQQEISTCSKKYIIIDGFPKTTEQCKAWNSALLDGVIYFNCSADDVMNNLKQNGSSTVSNIAAKIQQWTDTTSKVVDYYKESGKIWEVDAAQAPDQVKARCLKVLRETAKWELPVKEGEPVVCECENCQIIAANNSKCCLLL